MAPSRRAEEVVPALPEAQVFAAQVLPDTSPFMKDDIHRVFILQRFGKPVFDRLVLPGREFRLKSAEEPVPDDQEHTHVLVEVPGIGTMVYAVVRWRNEYIFQPAHFVYFFSVYQDPPGLGGGIDKGDINGPESAERDRDEINKTV